MTSRDGLEVEVEVEVGLLEEERWEEPRGL